MPLFEILNVVTKMYTIVKVLSLVLPGRLVVSSFVVASPRNSALDCHLCIMTSFNLLLYQSARHIDRLERTFGLTLNDVIYF